MSPPSVSTALVDAARAAAGRDPAHDFSHVLRVVTNVTRICDGESTTAEDRRIAVHAAMLHELFNYPKDHPDSHRSGDVCAERAGELLARTGQPAPFRTAVAACIRDHAFSRGAWPTTRAAQILQDADRLDAIGAIGIARWAATCAHMGTPFYHPDDPFCAEREPDDRRYGVDHFFRKLLRLESGLHTATARRIAGARTACLRTFLAQLADEIGARPIEE